MNHIFINDEDMLGSYVESFDGIIYEKNCEFIGRKYFEDKDGCRDGWIRVWSMKIKSRQKSGFNLT